MTYDEMYEFCGSKKESDGFCRCSSACSGPCLSNLGSDHPFPEGKLVFRGGNHGSCRFEIDRPDWW